jgi:peroxiredoxin
MHLKIGQEAPDFNLYDTNKQKVTLSDSKSKTNVLLLFFPLAFTSTCTAELCSVRDNYNMYTSLNVEVLGISVDSLFVLNKYRETENYNFKLLSDYNKTVSTAYGAIYDTFIFDMAGVSKRSAFIIDKSGIIRYAEVLENASHQPDFSKIKTVLESLN